jgi:hypothetical protein
MIYKQTHALHLTEDIWLPPGCETLVNCNVGRLPHRNEKQSIIIERIEILKFPDISTASGVGYVSKGRTVAGIANLGISICKIPKGI